METYKDLQNRYNELDKEAGECNRPEFDKVYKIISELVKDRNDVGDRGNLAFPLVAGDVIDEALRQSGFSDDKDFVSDFKRYREIEQKAREIQLNALSLPDHPANILLQAPKPEYNPDGWNFVPIRIIVPDFMQDMVNKQLEADLKACKGLYALQKTEIPIEDEDDDTFLMVEAYGLKCSNTAFYRELQDYGVIGSLFADKSLKTLFFQFLIGLEEFISNNTDKPNRTRNKISVTLKELDDIPGALTWQILLLQGLCRWLEGVNLNEGDNGYNEACELYTWLYTRTGEKEIQFCYYWWSDNDKEQLKSLCNYLYSTDIGEMTQRCIFKNTQPDTAKPQQLPLPPELLQALQSGGFIEDATAQPLKWLMALRDLNMFINTFYPNEVSKWVKTAHTFTHNGGQININSIKNLNPSHMNNPPSETYFRDLKTRLASNKR